jgi:hypothetical protein
MSKIMTLALASAVFVSGASLAQSGWDVEEYTKGEGSDATKVLRAMPADASASQVMLTCPDGDLRSVFALEPVDFANLNVAGASQQRKVNGELYINNEQVDRSSWTYVASRGVAAPRDNKVARKLFNSIVRNDDVAFKVSIKDTVQLDLPPADAQFKRFADGCKALREAEG